MVVSKHTKEALIGRPSLDLVVQCEGSAAARRPMVQHVTCRWMDNGYIYMKCLMHVYLSTGTEEYSLAQQYVFKLIKPGYKFQLYSHHQAYLQSLVELYMLNAYGMWDPSSEAMFTDGIKNMNHSVG
jgi:hypothetical protein